MNYFLLIDTSTQNCSVAIANDEMVLFQQFQNEGFNHAAILPDFVQACLQATNLKLQQISVVAISIGPGSYTGLRVGLSFAKALCIALKIPLITISTLEMMANGMIQICANEKAVYLPLIDARRMEVYAAAYNNELEIIDEPKALIINENSWGELINENDKIIVGGNGALKTKTWFVNQPKLFFIDDEINEAKYLFHLALQKLKHKIFSDIAYSEPFYLKEFNERI